jgi:hypothetical protein
MFGFISSRLLEIYGSLLEGIVCNSLAECTTFEINGKNSHYVLVGFLAHKLFSVFKLKHYIMDRLIERRMSPNISLSEYYEMAKKKIFLNFTVIDVNRERLAFLNKNTMPNMPLWAAILAASSVPFLHNFFDSNKEWESTTPEEFHDFFLYEFFKADADTDNNSRANKYTSANFVSSLPLELLTNDTIREKIYGKRLSPQSNYFKKSNGGNANLFGLK